MLQIIKQFHTSAVCVVCVTDRIQQRGFTYEISYHAASSTVIRVIKAALLCLPVFDKRARISKQFCISREIATHAWSARFFKFRILHFVVFLNILLLASNIFFNSVLKIITFISLSCLFLVSHAMSSVKIICVYKNMYSHTHVGIRQTDRQNNAEGPRYGHTPEK